ncbi:hypothetical protein EG329_004511 [Mollisiaceae sp. DMI_Dod_QoI]|nr:hypothetical protein EG329_004511 [Helotiales sp. DMI_Dod_QoI]
MATEQVTMDQKLLWTHRRKSALHRFQRQKSASYVRHKEPFQIWAHSRQQLIFSKNANPPETMKQYKVTNASGLDVWKALLLLRNFEFIQDPTQSRLVSVNGTGAQDDSAGQVSSINISTATPSPMHVQSQCACIDQLH